MKNGFGIVAMIVGIVGLVTSFTIFGLIMCIIALVFAIIAMCQSGKKKGMAIAGLACAAVGLMIFLFSSLIGMSGEGGSNNDSTSISLEDDGTDKAEQDITVEMDETDKVQQDTTVKKENEFTYNDLEVVYNESKIEKDKAGEECLVVYFTYTNNSDENQAFMYAFTVNAFQEGVELEGSWFQVNEETENKGNSAGNYNYSGTSIHINR